MPKRTSPTYIQNVVRQNSSRTAKNLKTIVEAASTPVQASINNTSRTRQPREWMASKEISSAPQMMSALPPSCRAPSRSPRKTNANRKVNSVFA